MERGTLWTLRGCVLWCFVGWAFPESIHAQNNKAAAAEALFVQGRNAMAEQRYDAACDYFTESNRLDAAVGTTFNLALCEKERGRVASAWALYRAVLQTLSAHDRRIPVAEQALRELEQRLPRLQVEVPDALPEGARVSRNEFELSEAMRGIALPVDPGTYVLKLEVPGRRTTEKTVNMAEGESLTARLELGEVVAAPVPPAAPASTAPVGSGGAPAPSANSVVPSPAAKASLPGPPSDATGSPVSRPVPAELSPLDFNVSLFHPVAISDSERHVVAVELGAVYSNVGAIDGFGGTVGLLKARWVKGVVLTGGASYVEGHTRGVALSYLLTLSRGRLDGVRLAGIGNIQAQRPDEATTPRPDSWGVHVAGVGNLVSGHFAGVQVAGGVNIGIGTLKGPQIAALSNVTMGDLTGFSLAGLNNSAGSLNGTQIALSNITTGKMDGFQLGLVNWGGRVNGVQLGLINLAGEVRGASVGLIPFNLKQGVQPTVWTSTAYPLNLGLRFGGGVLATTLSVATDEDLVHYSPGISVGVPIPLGEFILEPDIGYRTDLEGDAFRAKRYRGLVRLAVAWEVHPLLRVFGGPGVIQSYTPPRDGDDAHSVETDFLAFIGVSAFH
jgi:hypothetical protein